MSVLQTVQKNNRQFTYGQTVQKKTKKLFTYGQTVQKNNKQFTYGQTVQKKKKKHLHMDRQCKKKKKTLYIWTDSAKKKKNTLPMDRQCKKKQKNNLPMDRQCKKKKNNLHMDRQCKKNNKQFTYRQTVQKTTTAIYIWTDSAKKQQTIYIWTVHIYRLYRRQCAKYTYIYSVHIVYYKDILNYQRHIIHRMGTSALCTVSIHNVVYT